VLEKEMEDDSCMHVDNEEGKLKKHLFNERVVEKHMSMKQISAPLSGLCNNKDDGMTGMKTQLIQQP
jgi:hypothetical protein